MKTIEDEPILLTISQEKNVLPRAFRYLIDNNTANAAPYHNLHHVLRVMYYCNKGCEYHMITGKPRINLLVAAMFHDFNHSQGIETDDVNVGLAISSVEKWYSSNELNQSGVNIDKVVEIIKATQYPYIIEADDLTLEQSIIRDADLMPSLDSDWINNMIVGLMQEMNLTSFKAMAEGQKKFHSSIKMASPWGRSLYTEKWDLVFTNLELLRGLL